MILLFWIALSLIGIIFLGWVWVRLLELLLPLPYHPNEPHVFLTEDGWQLPLYRWLPESEAPKRSFPVVLCHGLGGNHHDLDFDEKYSLARYLRREGFDCWVLDLRSGNSPLIRPPQAIHRHDYNFDHQVDYDLPGAIHTVLEKTGAPQLHWVGHSMGGLLGFVYGDGAHENNALAVPGDHTQIRSLTALASPGHLDGESFPFRRLPPMLRPFRSLSAVSWISRLIAPVMPWLPSRAARPQSQEPYLTRLAPLHATADISTRLLEHFIQMAASGALCRGDGDPIYESRIRSCTVPAFFLAGSHDQVVPPSYVRYVYKRWVGPKRWQLCSPEEGFEGYGHTDIVWGKRAPEEIYPLVLEWIESQD